MQRPVSVPAGDLHALIPFLSYSYWRSLQELPDGAGDGKRALSNEFTLRLRDLTKGGRLRGRPSLPPKKMASHSTTFTLNYVLSDWKILQQRHRACWRQIHSFGVYSTEFIALAGNSRNGIIFADLPSGTRQ
jgi:hypothetical protein